MGGGASKVEEVSRHERRTGGGPDKTPKATTGPTLTPMKPRQAASSAPRGQSMRRLIQRVTDDYDGVGPGSPAPDLGRNKDESGTVALLTGGDMPATVDEFRTPRKGKPRPTDNTSRTFVGNDADLEHGDGRTQISALAKVKQSARDAAFQQHQQRRQQGVGRTVSNLGGGDGGTGPSADRARSAQNLAALREEDEDAPLVNGTLKMQALLRQVDMFRRELRSGMRDMSDADIEDLHGQQQLYGKLKQQMALQIAQLGRRVDIAGRNNKEEVLSFVESLIDETDSRPGNVECIAACLRHLVTVPWTVVCLERDWVGRVIKCGSPTFLDQLLQLPRLNDLDVRLDTVEALALIVEHKSARIPLAAVALRHWSVMRIDECRGDMGGLWQEFFASVASQRRAIPNEDRAQRQQVLSKLLSFSHMVDVNFNELDVEDNLTIPARAVAEGDSQLLKELSTYAVGLDWNVVLPTGDSYLTLGVRHNQRAAVEHLLTVPGIKYEYKFPKEGNALEIARAMGSQCSPHIVAALDAHFKGRTKEPGKQKTAAAAARSGAADAATVGRREQRLPYYLTHPQEPAFDEEWTIDTKSSPVTATAEVKEVLHALQEAWAQMDDAQQAVLTGDPAAQDAFLRLEADVAALKFDAAQCVFNIATRIVVAGDEGKDLVMATVERLLHEAYAEGSAALVRMLLYRVITVNFAPAIGEKHWAAAAAAAGHVELLEVLLRVPKLWAEEETVDLLAACIGNTERRCALCLVFLRYDEQLRLGTHAAHCRGHFQELFEVLAAPERLGEGDMSGRVELLYRLATHQHVRLHYDQEIGQSQTFFSRACKEGDVELVQVFLDLLLVKNINRVHTNQSTALMQAVVGNQMAVVELLMKEEGIDPTTRSPHGTALDIALKMKRDPDMAALLRDGVKKARRASEAAAALEKSPSRQAAQ